MINNYKINFSRKKSRTHLHLHKHTHTHPHTYTHTRARTRTHTHAHIYSSRKRNKSIKTIYGRLYSRPKMEKFLLNFIVLFKRSVYEHMQRSEHEIQLGLYIENRREFFVTIRTIDLSPYFFLLQSIKMIYIIMPKENR